MFKGSTTAHKVTKLHEQTTYSFRIRAANEAGYGPYSEIASCTTSIQPPAIIKGRCKHINLKIKHTRQKTNCSKLIKTGLTGNIDNIE